jgi:predicted ATPase/class 3 adenylate cyclase/Tfp pilus assembly protein PilF
MIGHALLFTDVVDSTRVVERLGDARAAEVWAEHDRRARDLLARHRGREIGRADGFFLLFDDPTEAARYALAYHQALADLALSARAGLHVGPVTLRENTAEDIARGAKSTEVEGRATPLTARVMALAGPGQTLLSRAAREALADRLPEGTEVKSHGHYRLKGVEAPLEIFELGVRGSSPFVPPADVDKAYRVVRAGELWCPLREIRHNLPAERDAFVGRTVELRTLAARLDAGIRQLTVLGPAGTGKTRFIRRYGLAWLGDWPGGVYFCDLSEARSLDGIYFAVAVALAVPLGKDDPGVQLGHAVAGRGRCLVILDNFEQVLTHASATLGRWLDRAADAAFVVTSRERLHLPGEEIFPIEPLPLENEAIDLFAARARAQRPEFVLGDANRAAVGEVVRLLDGLPLAIELAAARVRMLSPIQLVERMRDRFRLLAGARGAAARQATLRAAIDWSWDLLTPGEQAALAQCSVFEGGFTLEAAEEVLDLSSWPDASPVLDAVQALVDKSLLRTWIPAEQGRYDLEEPYFGMYLSIHEYAAEKLKARGREAKGAAEERHGRYFACFGTEEALDALFRHGGVRRRRALALELDNLVAACRRAVQRGDGDAAVAAYRAAWEVLELQGPFALGAVLGVQVLALDGMPASLRCAARVTQALASQRGGRMEEAGTWLQQALTLARETRDRRREGSVLFNLGYLHREQGRMKEAREHLEAALAIHRDMGDRRAEGTELCALGIVHFDEGRMEEARGHLEAALVVAREVGNRSIEGSVLGNLGVLHYEHGRIAEARAHYQQALAIIRDVGNRSAEGLVLGNLGNLNNDQGRVEEARVHYEAALAIFQEVGNRRFEGFARGNLGNLHFEQGRVEEARGHLEAALAIAREVGDRRDEGIVLGILGLVHRDQGEVEKARAHYQQALAIHRQVGNRSFEGIVLGDLGLLQYEQGRMEDARAHYEAALAIHREMGHRRGQGGVLGKLADLLVQQGQIREAKEALRESEALLRQVGNPLELAKLLCIRGRVETTVGELDAARAALAEAETAAAAIGIRPDCELGREIAKLREAIA